MTDARLAANRPRPVLVPENARRLAVGPDLQPLLARMQELAASGAIDGLANLEGSPVWVFRSPLDPLVGRALTEATIEQYRSLGAAVTFVGDVEAAHGVPTLATGAPCANFEPPYLNACDYDAVGAMLATLEGTLAPRGSADGDVVAVPVPGAADAGLLAGPRRVTATLPIPDHYLPNGIDRGVRFNLGFESLLRNRLRVADRLLQPRRGRR